MKCFWICELGKRLRGKSLLEFVRQLFNITVYQCKEMHEMHLVTVVRLKVGDSQELILFRDWSGDGDSINSLRYLASQIVSGFSMRLLTIQSLVLKLTQHGLPANKPAPGVDWRTAPQQHMVFAEVKDLHVDKIALEANADHHWEGCTFSVKMCLEFFRDHIKSEPVELELCLLLHEP